MMNCYNNCRRELKLFEKVQKNQKCVKQNRSNVEKSCTKHIEKLNCLKICQKIVKSRQNYSKYGKIS